MINGVKRVAERCTCASRRAFCPSLLITIIAFLPLATRAQVTTSQYDNARTGADVHETILTPRNVNANQFGKLFALHVDGDVYAQPLYLPHIAIPGKGTHNVLLVATEYDSVYAFDADAPSQEPLWHARFYDPGKAIEPLTPEEVACPFIVPTIGITSTPVIDAAAGTIYVLARTSEHGAYFQKLHALDVTTGAERPGSPVTIQASAPHKTLGLVSNPVAFDPVRENPRAALLLSNGTVYLSWASSCDVGPYHGWVIAYDARTLTQVGVFNTSPDSEESGIWAGDAGPAADSTGNVFVATGNGPFDAASKGGRDYGDSVLKLALTSSGLTVADYFTPFNQDKLNAADNDLGSGGPVLLPDQPGPHPHVLVVGGKGATIYLIDRDHMGKFHAGDDTHAVQTLPVHDMIFGAAAYWNGHIYYLVSHDVLRDFSLQDGKLSLAAHSTVPFADPGATPTVSANGTKDGIVWVIETKGFQAPDRRSILHAFEAANVAHELYNNAQNNDRDWAGRTLRFTIPTVANGRVYIGTKNEVDVYGLLPAARKQK
jgi:hypothetical protein